MILIRSCAFTPKCLAICTQGDRGSDVRLPAITVEAVEASPRLGRYRCREPCSDGRSGNAKAPDYPAHVKGASEEQSASSVRI